MTSAVDPMTWREATPSEIREYYRTEFPTYLDALPGHITAAGPTEWALAFDQPYPVKGDEVPDRDFIRRPTRRTNAADEPVSKYFSGMADVVEFIQSPARRDPLRADTNIGLADPAILDTPAPVPTAVYYALDHWDRNWVLAVDIDAKDIATAGVSDRIHERYDTTDAVLTHGGVIDSPPAGKPYEFRHIDRSLEYAFEVADLFENRLGASETLVVYSGQGAHVYLLDDDTAHRYDAKTREVLTDLLQHEFEIPIDPRVTADERRVLRLPYSLHAEVSRIVTPIESPEFDYRTESCPEFIDQ